MIYYILQASIFKSTRGWFNLFLLPSNDSKGLINIQNIFKNAKLHF